MSEIHSNDTNLTLTQHLEELRKRLIYSLIALLIGFVIAWPFSKFLFDVLMQPVLNVLPEESRNLHFTNPVEPFFTYLKVAFVSGFFISVPIVFYHIWKFISPALYKNEKKFVIPFSVAGSFFFIGGAFFGYFIVFPIGFNFLINFAGDNILPVLTIKEYLSLSTSLLFAFGIIFELPVFIFLLIISNIVSIKRIQKFRRYAYFLTFVIGAMLTPPDVITQIMMAIPMCLLYELGILAGWLFKRKNKK